MAHAAFSLPEDLTAADVSSPVDLLRVIRKGPMVKQAVDDAIDQCAEVMNLRDSIEEARSRAEQAPDERQRRLHAHRGLQNLRRYFELIIFQAYLQSTEPDTVENHESFESFVKERPGMCSVSFCALCWLTRMCSDQDVRERAPI